MDGPGTRRRPWSSDDQRRLLAGLRAGVPPRRLCRELDRDAADVRHRLLTLLGDPPGPAPADPVADLDLLWLRVRAGSVLPTPTAGEDVVAAWEDATGVRLSTAQRADLLAEDPVPRLLSVGRHVLRSRAVAVVVATGMLDLDDWADAVDPGPGDTPIADDAAPTAGPDDEAAPPGMRPLLDAAVEDVVPDLPRSVLRAHLGLPAGSRDTPPALPVDAERRERGRAVVEVLRAASLPDRPAAMLRDQLLDDAALRTLVRDLRLGVPAATTLGLLGGRQEAESLRVAGQALTRWHRPPNLGRGVVVHIRT